MKKLFLSYCRFNQRDLIFIVKLDNYPAAKFFYTSKSIIKIGNGRNTVDDGDNWIVIDCWSIVGVPVEPH